MDDLVARVLLVTAVVAVAGVVAMVTSRTRTHHPAVDIAGLGLPPGVIVFTSTNCRRCREVLAVAKSLDVPLREVTFELEPGLQQRAGVVGVPLTLVIDRSGHLVAQLAGRVGRGTLRRASSRAGF